MKKKICQAAFGGKEEKICSGDTAQENNKEKIYWKINKLFSKYLSYYHCYKIKVTRCERLFIYMLGQRQDN